MNIIKTVNFGLGIINNTSLYKNMKSDVIDPFALIVVLALLSYYPIGSKISINNNRIYIQEKAMYQGIQRYMHGDICTDINILFMPIEYALNNYLLSADRNKFIELFKKSSLGLSQLLKTYQGKTISFTIKKLIDLFDEYININIDDQDNLYENQSNDYSLIKKNPNIDKIKINIYEQIKNAWTNERYNIVFELFNQLEKKNSYDRSNILDSIESYIRDVESDSIDIISCIVNK